MYLHYSLLLTVNNYELVIFVSLFKWYKTYTCNYIYLQLYIYFVIVNLLLINIFRIFFLLILLPYIEILAPPLGSSIWNQGMHVRSPSFYKVWCCISGWWHFKREMSYFSWIWVSLSLCEIARACRNMCMCDKFFFFFFFCFTWFSLSLSLSEITCANRLCMCETIFSFLFLFLLDMILVMIFFWEPHTSKKDRFPWFDVGSSKLVYWFQLISHTSCYRIVFKEFQIERSRQRRIIWWNMCTFLVGFPT